MQSAIRGRFENRCHDHNESIVPRSKPSKESSSLVASIPAARIPMTVTTSDDDDDSVR